MLQDCTQRRKYRDEIQQAAIAVPGADNVAFRLLQWPLELDKNMEEPKQRESGENDLHLSMPGVWNLSYYSDIYEVPESFLCLLSQVIRLNNEKDLTHEPTPGTQTMSLPEFLSRAKALEQCICDWKPPPGELSDKVFADDSGEVRNHIVKNMLEALHQSLLIYFYRMIYNVDATTLQGRVEMVRERLTDSSAKEIGIAKYTAAFVWPGFIAASEALDPIAQASFSQWFEFNISCSGLQTYSTILQIVRQVWAMRRVSGDTRTSWVDVLREQNMCMFWS